MLPHLQSFRRGVKHRHPRSSRSASENRLHCLANPCRRKVTRGNLRCMHSPAEPETQPTAPHTIGGVDVVPAHHIAAGPYSEPVWPMPDECRVVVDRKVLSAVPDFAAFAGLNGTPATNGYLISSSPQQPHRPEEIFPKLRWGGQFFFASRSRRETRKLASDYANYGFALEQPPAAIAMAPFPRSLFTRGMHYFVARKTALVAPGETTDRFTHFVDLEIWKEPRELQILDAEEHEVRITRMLVVSRAAHEHLAVTHAVLPQLKPASWEALFHGRSSTPASSPARPAPRAPAPPSQPARTSPPSGPCRRTGSRRCPRAS